VIDHRFDALISDVYEAVLAETHWSLFLEKLKEHFESSVIHILQFDGASERLTLSHAFGAADKAKQAGISEFENYYPECPGFEAMKMHPGKPIHCRQVLTDAALYSSEMYKNVLVKDDVEFTLGVLIEVEPTIELAFVLMRGREGLPFQNEDCQKLGILVPHLRQAMKIRSRFLTLRFLREIAGSAFDEINLGVLMLNADLGITAINRQAASILDAACTSSDRLEILDLADTEAELEIRAVLDEFRIQRCRGNLPAARTVFVKRGSNNAPLSMVLAPSPFQDTGSEYLAAGSAIAVVAVRDPEVLSEIEPELLAQLFGLTSAEAYLAEGLSRGQTLSSVAVARGTSIGTARQQLKQIFRKTEVDSQRELMGLLLRIPSCARNEQHC
jgi:DNA-binding CsgD family transcriptional regulator/PAS domain-containing protein